MATQYTKQAQNQLNPVFNQQQQAIQSQVPAIQNLYQTLSQGLQTNFDTQLASGVQGINEDASARGVLRSTLPNDARLALTTQLGSALQQGLGQLGSQQASDISGVQSQLGELGIRRVSAITDLANALKSDNLAERQFALDKLTANRDFKISQEELGLKRSSQNYDRLQNQLPTATKKKGGGYVVSGDYDLAGYAKATGKDLITLLSQGDEKDKQAARWYSDKIRKYASTDNSDLNAQRASQFFYELQQDRPTAFYKGG